MKLLLLDLYQRLVGKVFIRPNARLRAVSADALFRMGDAQAIESLPYHWTAYAYVRFWKKPLHFSIETKTGTLNSSELNAIHSAMFRNEEQLRAESLNQLMQWFNTYVAEPIENQDKRCYVAPLDTQSSAIRCFGDPVVLLDLTENTVPGNFILEFYYKQTLPVKISCWQVQARNRR